MFTLTPVNRSHDQSSIGADLNRTNVKPAQESEVACNQFYILKTPPDLLIFLVFNDINDGFVLFYHITQSMLPRPKFFCPECILLRTKRKRYCYIFGFGNICLSYDNYPQHNYCGTTGDHIER